MWEPCSVESPVELVYPFWGCPYNPPQWKHLPIKNEATSTPTRAQVELPCYNAARTSPMADGLNWWSTLYGKMWIMYRETVCSITRLCQVSFICIFISSTSCRVMPSTPVPPPFRSMSILRTCAPPPFREYSGLFRGIKCRCDKTSHYNIKAFRECFPVDLRSYDFDIMWGSAADWNRDDGAWSRYFPLFSFFSSFSTAQ
jgi:hypothetical protein